MKTDTPDSKIVFYRKYFYEESFLWVIIPLLVVEEASMISELSWVYRRTWCGLKQMGRKEEIDRDAKERLLGDETPEFEPVDR